MRYWIFYYLAVFFKKSCNFLGKNPFLQPNPICKLWAKCGPFLTNHQLFLCPFCGRLWSFCVLLWPSCSPSVVGYDPTITGLWPYHGCLWPPHYVKFVIILSWIRANSVMGLRKVYDPHLKVCISLLKYNVVTQN